jgi:hypothetical protein
VLDDFFPKKQIESKPNENIENSSVEETIKSKNKKLKKEKKEYLSLLSSLPKAHDTKT